MLRRLEALLASGVLTQAEAVSCAGLADALRRPARVAIFGHAAKDVTGVLRAMLGESLMDVVPGGPALQLSYATAIQHSATFEDGSSLSQEGYPTDSLMGHGPLFLKIEAPLEMLETMSFLAMELGEDPESYAPALRWAAKRSEIAILCAEGFGDPEAALWAAAPDRLKNHCYLVTTGDRDPASARARGLFDAVVHAPSPSEASPPLSVLKRRLATDISDARQEDVDAAALFLHRFRREEVPPVPAAPIDPPALERPPADASPAGASLGEALGLRGDDEALSDEELGVKDAPLDAGEDLEDAGFADAPIEDTRPEPEPEPEPEAEPEQPMASFDPEPEFEEDDEHARIIARALVSAPILHLKRRSRALAELLEWREEDEDWSEEVLNHCAETAEDLRELLIGWPDDDPMVERLQTAVDEACDTVVLLQAEAGPDQAEDAARVLCQLRTDFEQAMAA